MSSRTFRVVLLLLAALGAHPAEALDPSLRLTQYVQSVWRVEDGLPHNSVRAVVQTRDGYLWLGTYGGLARFDGSRFVVFDNRSSALLHNAVTSLAEDRDGTLWIGTSVGGLYRMRDGGIERFRGITHRSINAIAAAPDGTVWVATTAGAYAVRNGAARRFGEAEGAPAVVYAIAVDGEAVWLGTSRGLYRVHGSTVTHASPAIGDSEVRAVYRDPRGHIWAGTADHVVELARDSASGSLRPLRTLVIPGVWGWINAFLEDSDGVLWIGTYGGGLYRWWNGRLDGISTPQGLLDHRPWALMEDAEGSLWVGSRGGLARLRDGAAIAFSVEEGLPSPVTRAVVEDRRDGTVWIATENGLATVRGDEVVPFSSPSFNLGAVRSVVWDRNGALWTACDRGLAQIDAVQGRAVRTVTAAEGLPDARVRNLFFDSRGRTWAGTERGVVMSETGPAHPPWRLPEGLEALAGESIEAFYEDDRGGIWIGTLAAGMWRWADGHVERPVLVEDTSVGVRTFHEDDDGTFYVGTLASGLFIRRPGRPFVRVSTKEGLPDDGIWAILPAGDTLWMPSDRGVFGVRRSALLEVVDGRRTTVPVERLVGAHDGMKSAECNGGGSLPGFIGRDGRIWVATSRGAVAIDPRKLVRNRRPPPVKIEEVVVDGRVASGAGTVEVPPGSREVEVHFTALSFVDPQRVRFRYRLTGGDPWHDTGSRRAAYFSNLGPGTYELHVQAANNDGVWNLEGARISMRVRPRLHETWWFRALAVLAVALAVASWVILRTMRHRRSEAELRRLVAERTEDLERANQQLEQLAAIDDLTGIANHRHFLVTLEQEWRRCLRSAEPLSLLLCDVDDFKAYNDTYGHLRGDDCLRHVAAAMTMTVPRHTDLVARYGGEEFVIVLPATDAAGAHEVAERVRTAVRRLGIEHRASRAAAVVTVSIGCATADPHTGRGTLSDLLAAADEALYAAKDAGRDRVVSAAEGVPSKRVAT